MERAILYIHGKGGSAAEAEHYRSLCPQYDVIGLDYRASTPWEARTEFAAAWEELVGSYCSVVVIANSIGAFFAMNGLAEKRIERALFISPVVDMEKLISDMMRWSNVTEAELKEKREIETAFGETLSWEYLCYVRENPVQWNVPTDILYAAEDDLTAYETISRFAARTRASLTIMENGGHWFHTEEQMAFLDNWLKGLL